MEAGISSGQHGSGHDPGYRSEARSGSHAFCFCEQVGKAHREPCLLLYFLDRLKAYGNSDPGRCCVAVTEENSYLASHARSYGFLATFLDPPGIKGRYSSLLHFGLLMSALWRFDAADLVSRAVAMRDLCRTAGAQSGAHVGSSIGGKRARGSRQAAVAQHQESAGIHLSYRTARRCQHL